MGLGGPPSIGAPGCCNEGGAPPDIGAPGMPEPVIPGLGSGEPPPGIGGGIGGVGVPEPPPSEAGPGGAPVAPGGIEGPGFGGANDMGAPGGCGGCC